MPKARKQIVVVKTTKKPKRPANAGRKGSQRTIAKTVGALVGGSIAGPVGSRIGSTAASYIARIMGQGDYKISKNTLMTDNGPPSFSTNGDDVIIKHREFVSDILSSTSFVNNRYLINPGNAILFPWLSGLARNFEEYEFLGLVVEYKSTSGSAIASTNNALGAVVIATDYNVTGPVFTNKREMETSEFSTSAGTDSSFLHPIECDKTRNVLPRQYVTTETTIGPELNDPRFYYLGATNIATVGQQAANIVIGELWVSYQVRLSRPVFPHEATSLDNDLPYVHSSNKLSEDCSMVNRIIVNGDDLKVNPAYPLPNVQFNMNILNKYESNKVYTTFDKAGLYRIQWNYKMYCINSGSVLFYTSTTPGFFVGTNPPGILSFNVDAVANTSSQPSVNWSVLEGTKTLTAGNSVTASGHAEVIYKPGLMTDPITPPQFYLPRSSYSVTSGVWDYTVDIKVIYVSPSNHIRIQDLTTSKDEIKDQSDILPHEEEPSGITSDKPNDYIIRDLSLQENYILTKMKRNA